METELIGTIIVAVISLAGTLTGSYFASRKSIALIAYRLEQLEKKVEKHNQIVERTYKLESCISEHEVELETNTKRIDKLEDKI